jgi:Domain of unknown function (DUF5667)
MSKGMLTVLLSLLLVLVASGMLVSAADAAVPGDWMYGLDRAMDGLRLRLAVEPKQKAQVERQLAQERLREAQTLTRRGESSSVELLRQESRLALLAAKAADPHNARKTEKSAGKTATAARIEQKEQHFDQNEPAKGDLYCSGTATKHLPTGEKLVQRLGVSYSELMDWYCQGYGFGEIGLAYRISRAAGVGVNELFAQRLGGLSWGKIMQKYKLYEKED